jgi:hypothetical protein
MVYSTLVGLRSEYAILMSEEFRERVKEIAQSGEEVDIPGQVFPGDVRDAETDD